MSIGGALIGAAGSLLGGVFGKSKSYSPREMSVGHVEGVMQASEAFGINPLTILGAIGGPSAVTGQNYMGSAIADAAMLLGDAVSKNKEKQQLTQKNEQIAKLQKRIDNLTLRPKVGGIYAQLEETPTIGAALGRGSQSALGRGAGFTVDPNLGQDENPLARGREKQVEPVLNSSGIFEIQNALTANRPVYMYGEGPDDVMDLVLQSPIVAPQVGWNWVAAAADKGKRDRQAFIDRYGKSPREALVDMFSNSSAVLGSQTRKIKKKPKP